MADSPLQPVAARDDEIDLIELVQKIWRGRYVVLALFILGAGVAAAYAFTATQQWTSIAYVVKPELDQVTGYVQQERVLAQAAVVSQAGQLQSRGALTNCWYTNQAAVVSQAGQLQAGQSQSGQAVGSQPLDDFLFGRFISEAAARNNRLAYLSHTAYYAALVKRAHGATSHRALLARLADKLKVSEPGKGQVNPYYTLSFSARTAAQAQKVLAGYVQWVNDRANKQAHGVFENRIQDATLTLQNAIDSTALEVKVKRQNAIDKLEHALHTAQLAGIKDNAMASPQGPAAGTGGQVDGGQLFLLGEKLLGAQLKSAKQAALIYPPDYYKAKQALAQLKALGDGHVKATLYAYQLQPTLPVHRDKPRRSLIVLLGAIVGILVGCFLVLVLDALRAHRRLPPRDAA